MEVCSRRLKPCTSFLSWIRRAWSPHIEQLLQIHFGNTVGKKQVKKLHMFNMRKIHYLDGVGENHNLNCVKKKKRHNFRVAHKVQMQNLLHVARIRLVQTLLQRNHSIKTHSDFQHSLLRGLILENALGNAESCAAHQLWL
jgi:hypothetical protein